MDGYDQSGYSSDDIAALPVATNLRALLSQIREYPGLVGYRLTISHIDSFIAGYIFARRSAGIYADGEYMSSFNNRVHEHFDTMNTLGWSVLIERATENEEAALELFWKLYDDYTARILLDNPIKSDS